MEQGEAWVGDRGVRATMEGSSLVRIELLPLGRPLAIPRASASPGLAKVLAQLRAYLSGQAKSLDACLRLQGTEFQLSVWAALRGVPYGSTITYAGLAARAGRPKAARAVGAAMAANPVPLFVPCHRVVAASGIGGFSPGLAWKRRLFALEGMQP